MQASLSSKITELNLQSLEMYEGDDHEAMREIRKLRALCWPRIYAGGNSLDDEFDACSIHWVLRGVDSRMLAAARLSFHTNFKILPDPHLFAAYEPGLIRFPAGYISRLVVHPEARGRGIAVFLEETRIRHAIARGCKSMIAVWNPESGTMRQRQLLRRGFRSLDGETGWPDGPFGLSYVYFMDLTSSETQIDE